jgi:heme-degrading monooxygenase HmoA
MSMSTGGYAETPEPPYFAVIFTSARTEGDRGYAEMAEAMVTLASAQPGFLGIESVRGSDGLGITVSYWTSEEAIRAWKANSEHRVAQRLGHERWYGDFVVRVAKVERAYGKSPRGPVLPGP